MTEADHDAALAAFAHVVWDFIQTNARVNVHVLGCPACAVDTVLASLSIAASFHDRKNHPSDDAWMEEQLARYHQGLLEYVSAQNNQESSPVPTHPGTGTAQ